MAESMKVTGNRDTQALLVSFLSLSLPVEVYEVTNQHGLRVL